MIRSGGVRRDPWGLAVSHTALAGRQVRSLSAGRVEQLPEVVLLPGLGAAASLVPWTRRTATWSRATLLDLPGRRARTGPAHLAAVGDTVAEWLEATAQTRSGRRRVVLVGHSTGAQAVLSAAADRPDLVAGLVLAGPTFDPAARTPLGLALRTATTLAHVPLAAAIATLPAYLHTGPVQLTRYVRTAVAARPEALIARLEVPVLLIGAPRDGFASPAWVRRLGALSGAPVAFLPGGHAAPFTFSAAADRLTRAAVLGWMRRTVTTPSPPVPGNGRSVG